MGSRLGRVGNVTKLWQPFGIPCYHISFRILTIVRYQRPRYLATFELGLFEDSLLADSFFTFAAMCCHRRRFRVDLKSKHLGTCVCLWYYRRWIFRTIWKFVRKMVLDDGVVGAGDTRNWKIAYQLAYAKLLCIKWYDKMIRSFANHRNLSQWFVVSRDRLWLAQSIAVPCTHHTCIFYINNTKWILQFWKSTSLRYRCNIEKRKLIYFLSWILNKGNSSYARRT